jgi:hypothetical protein
MHRPVQDDRANGQHPFLAFTTSFVIHRQRETTVIVRTHRP